MIEWLYIVTERVWLNTERREVQKIGGWKFNRRGKYGEVGEKER